MVSFNSQHLKSIIAEILGVPEDHIKAGAGMDSIDLWDSFAVVNMVVSIEQETGLSVSPDELENFTTFDGILQLLASKGVVFDQ